MFSLCIKLTKSQEYRSEYTEYTVIVTKGRRQGNFFIPTKLQSRPTVIQATGRFPVLALPRWGPPTPWGQPSWLARYLVFPAFLGPKQEHLFRSSRRGTLCFDLWTQQGHKFSEGRWERASIGVVASYPWGSFLLGSPILITGFM